MCERERGILSNKQENKKGKKEMRSRDTAGTLK